MGCVRRLYLMTQRLESDLHNHAEIFAHLSALASANRNTEIRIIAQNTRVAATQEHYLIHLTQKLPTYVQIRITVTPAHHNFRESWLIEDNSAYLRRRHPERYEGYYEHDNKLEAALTSSISMKYGRSVSPLRMPVASACRAPFNRRIEALPVHCSPCR